MKWHSSHDLAAAAICPDPDNPHGNLITNFTPCWVKRKDVKAQGLLMSTTVVSPGTHWRRKGMCVGGCECIVVGCWSHKQGP